MKYLFRSFSILLLYFSLSIVITLGLFLFFSCVLIKKIDPNICLNLQEGIYFIYFFIILFAGIIYLILRKRETYLLYSLYIYLGIISTPIILFYFFHFRHDVFELQELSDDLFITKYQNREVKDDENLYTYVSNIMNPEYTGTGLFGKYKQKLNDLYKNDNYEEELKEAEKIYKCYLNEKEIQFCDNLPLEKYLETKNFPLILDEAKIFSNTLKIINKHSIFKLPKNPSSYQGITQKLRSHFYYNIENLEKNNTQDVITYFQENYTLFSHILQGDISIVEMAISISSLGILNNQLSHILDTYSFSKEEVNTLETLLLEIKNNFNSEEIYANIFKYEYQSIKSAIDTGVILSSGNLDLAPQNFLYNYDKTIQVLKNIYYFKHINRDPILMGKFKVEYGKEKILLNLLRYNIFGNYQTSQSYIMFDISFIEDLNKTKDEINNLILKLQNL